MRHDTNQPGSEATRRTMLQSAGALAAGLLTTTAKGAGEVQALAQAGGKPAVTIPSRKQVDAARWPIFGDEEEKAIVDFLKSPGYGPIAALEADWKDYFQVPFAKAQCNGTSAIASMFFALDLPPGSEILVPSYTFFASVVPMRVFGLVPVFVDVNPRTLNFDVNDAKRRLTKNTKAVFPVHWMGLPCAMDEINDFAKEHGLVVLEDVAHSPGASLKGKPLGTWSRMSIFSYQATKPIPAMEGGMGMFQNREDYERATSFGHSDIPASFPATSPYRKYEGSGLGLKLRMNPLAAVLARIQLRKLKARNEEGVAQVRKLNDRLTQLPGLFEPTMRPDMSRLYYSSNILFLDEAKAGFTRDALIKALQAEGVRATAHRYRLQHKLSLYKEASWWHHAPTIPELPGSDEANRTAVGLPYWTTPVPDLVEQYAQAFEKVWANRKSLATG